MKNTRAFLSALLLLSGPVVLCGPAAAQEPSLPYATSARELDRLQWDRDRELMHPGIPLTIVGLEQGDNGFRERTPGLEHSDRALALVDDGENYRRRLAMYEEGVTFQAAPRVIGHVTLGPRPKAPARQVVWRGLSEPLSATRALSWGVGLLLVTLLLVLLRKVGGRVRAGT